MRAILLLGLIVSAVAAVQAPQTQQASKQAEKTQQVTKTEPAAQAAGQGNAGRDAFGWIEALHIFLLGVAGSAAIEIKNLLDIYQATRFETGQDFPKRYGRVGFWVVRALLAILGGVMAYEYGVSSRILALHIGASTPTILETFTRRSPADIGGR